MFRLASLIVAVFSISISFAQTNSLEQFRKRLEEEHRVRQQKLSSLRLQTQPSTFGNTTIIVTDVDRNGQPIYRMTFNAGAAKTTGADLLQSPSLSGLNITGKDMLIGVWDGGTVKDHIEFKQRLVSQEGTDYNAHATHVTGTLIAEGVNPAARGMAPGAKATTHFFSNDLPVMAALAAPGQESLIISNHSYGTGTGWVVGSNGWMWTGDASISSAEDFRFGLYNPRAMELDEMTFLAPYYSIFWAVGNDRADVGNGTHPADCNAGTGYDCIIPDAVAKNIFTIGAVNKVTAYNSPASVVMSNYTSWGPTDDGRIKPDLVAAGSDLTSTTSNGVNAYEVQTGTSMATPNASGSLALVQQLYHDLHGGSFMKSATLKALAIHTAKEAGSFPGPDYVFGWGLVDAAAAGQLLMNEDRNNQLKELTLNNGQKIEIPFSSLANRKVTATIAWTDPHGTIPGDLLDPSVLALVNDLDIRVVDNNNAEQRPWILDPLNPTRQATRGDNFRDNVEKIEFTGEAKNYKLVVSHKGNLKNGKQDFSVVLTFQDATPTTTYYWIGNSGNWNAPSHWSFTSNGASASKVPGPNDRVIFDENSFKIPGQAVSLTADVSSRSVVWISSSDATVNLNGHVFTVTEKLNLNSSTSPLNGGKLQLKALVEGEANFNSGTHSNLDIEVASGKWNWKGNADVNKLDIKSDVDFSSASLKVKELAFSSDPLQIRTDNTTVNVSEKVNIAASKIAFGGDNGKLIFSGVGSTYSLDQIRFFGDVEINDATVNITGDGLITRVNVNNGKLNVTSKEMGLVNLFMRDGSELLVGSNAEVIVDSLSLQGTAQRAVKLSGATFSKIILTKRNKYCFDYLNVSAISISDRTLHGSVNAGLHSTVANSGGWQQTSCDEMIYADFSWTDACLNSIISFKDESGGAPTIWDWDMNGTGIRLAMIGAANTFFAIPDPYYIFKEEKVQPVYLAVVKGNVVDAVVKDVTIRANPLPPNEIIQTTGGWLSKVPGERYQWFLNGTPIEGETSRTLPDSKYQRGVHVAAYSGGCNSASAPHLIMGAEDASSEIVIYPNPASERFAVSGLENTPEVALTDVTGRTFVLRNTHGSFETSQLANGLYVLRINLGQQAVTRKLIINRQ